ncbi:hypothetical protein [Dialister succinatiphilus]|uniref:hypothetical protein n=1 Tax=Dialister succinatiphilus TaxID=487173 RepID=UPI0040263E42
MNTDQDYYDEHYKPRMEEYFWPFHFLNGKTEILASCDTLQVPDYSRYRMASWDETKKKAHQAEQFPKDLQAAFALGKRLASRQ